MQSTATSHTKATIMQHFVAYFIDSFIAYIPSMILGIISYKLMPVGYVFTLGYFLLRDALPIGDGQGVGKKLMKIKVIHDTTETSILGDYTASFVRQLSMIIPFLNLYDMWLLVSDGKRLGDQWAKTHVVQVKVV